MIRQNKRKLLLTSLIILLPMLAGLLLWGRLPERMPTHWGVDGTVDGWSGKAFAVLGMPAILLAMHWLCVAITAADPKNKDQTPKIVGLILWLCPLISVAVGVMTYATALGADVRVGWVMPIALGVMFVVIGNYLPKCKQNFTIGIKVPWTMADEANWNATHRFGGKVWVAGGMLLMACAFLPTAAVPFALVGSLILLSVVPVVYSYLYYRKHK